MCIIECNFSFEAKTFYLSAKDGYLEFRFKERRKGFVGYIFASIQCSMWLVDSVEAAIQAEVKEEIAKTFCEGDKATMVHMGGNKAGRFLEVSVMVEGGYKGVIWLPEGRFGRGWQCFAGELRHLLAAESKYMAEHGVPSSAGRLLDAPLSLVSSGGRSFVDVLRSTTGVEAKAVDFKVCCLRSLDLFPVSSCFESESDDLGLRFAVDCSALESLPTLLVAAAGSVRLRKKKKGKISISGLLRLLGQIQRKLDRVHAGVALKPNRRRKRVLFWA